MSQFLRRTINSRFDDVGAVGEAVHAMAQTVWPADLVGDLQTCVVEAVNNVIEHAYRGEPGHSLTVSVGIGDDGMAEIVLEDHGQPLPAALLAGAPPAMPDFDADDLDSIPEGGFGLALIWTLVDEVRYESRDGTNVLRMFKAGPQ